MSREDLENGDISWRSIARQQQTEFYTTHGDRTWWSGNPKTEQDQLERKIGSILFKTPQPDGQNEPDISNYDIRDIIAIKNIVKQINKTFKGEISAALVQICIHIKTQEDLASRNILRIWNTDKQIFMDSSNGIYGKWSEYISNIKLPKCSYCYPENGRYNIDDCGELKLVFAESVVNKHLRLLLKYIDMFFIIIALMGLILGIVSQAHVNAFEKRTESILTIVAVSLIASAGLYNLVRCGLVSQIIFKY